MNTRELITTLFIFFSLMLAYDCKADVLEEGFNLNRKDHQLHFGVSMGLSFALSETFKAAKMEYPQGLAMLTVVSLGVLKECLDPQFSTGDLTADFLGALSGSLLSVTIHF